MKWLLAAMAAIVFFSCNQKTNDETESSNPNIIIFYADDMGFGDLEIQNPDSKIPTPNLNQLAKDGMRFTDGHSSSGICSPSRYALLTGNYHWRRQHQIVASMGKPFFNESDITLPQMLKTKGYKTAVIGKWHLGWNWEWEQEPEFVQKSWGKNYLPKPNDIDWTKPIKGGPLDRGFDYYFGDGTINFPPYAWVENDRILEAPTEIMDGNKNVGFETKESSWEFRYGPRVAGWNPYEVLPTLADKAVEYINQQENDQPFFFYLSFPSPHAPIIPNDEFDGTSEAGAYGDFIVQTDDIIGRVLATLKEKGLEDNTIVIFSADNGPEHYAWNRAIKFDHFSMGKLRGLKRDVWEGGHHVPFIVKWPGKIKAGSVSDETISQVDITATIASVTGIEIPEGSAVDSYDFLPVWKGQKYNSPLREATVHNTYENVYGLRKGDWLYINNSSGGHRKPSKAFNALPERKYEEFSTEGLLFNMNEDREQRVNLFEEHPDKVQELAAVLKKYQSQGFSVQRNN